MQLRIHDKPVGLLDADATGPLRATLDWAVEAESVRPGHRASSWPTTTRPPCSTRWRREPPGLPKFDDAEDLIPRRPALGGDGAGKVNTTVTRAPVLLVPAGSFPPKAVPPVHTSGQGPDGLGRPR